MNRISLLVAGILWVSAAAVSAAVPDWTALLAAAREQHPDFRAAKEDEVSAREQADAAQGGYYPTVSLFADRTREEADADVLGLRQKSDTTTDSYGVKARWNLFSGFATWGNQRKTEAVADSAAAVVSSTWLTLRGDLRKAYDNALVSKESLVVYQNLQKRYRDQVKIIEAKYKGGLEAQWAVDLARSNLSLVEVSVGAEKLSLEKSLESLSRLTGLKLTDVTSDSRYEKIIEPKRPVFHAETHPLLQKAQADRSFADAEVTVTRATFLPSVDFTLQSGRAKTLEQEPANKTTYSLTLPYPLFEGFAGTNNYSAARARRRAAEIRQDETLKALNEQEDQSWRQLEVDRQQLLARQLELRGARAYADSTSLQYRLGARKFAEWDNAQTRLLQAEKNYLSARRQWLGSYADWEKVAAVGEEK